MWKRIMLIVIFTGCVVIKNNDNVMIDRNIEIKRKITRFSKEAIERDTSKMNTVKTDSIPE